MEPDVKRVNDFTEIIEKITKDDFQNINEQNKNYKEALSQLKKALNANPQRQDLLTNIRALEGLIQREG